MAKTRYEIETNQHRSPTVWAKPKFTEKIGEVRYVKLSPSGWWKCVRLGHDDYDMLPSSLQEALALLTEKQQPVLTQYVNEYLKRLWAGWRKRERNLTALESELEEHGVWSN